MNKPEPPAWRGRPDPSSGGQPDTFLDLREIFGVLRRHIGLILLCTILGLIGAFAYIFRAEPLYTATGSILIDPLDATTEQVDTIALSERGIDSNSVESQVEVLRSERLALDVANRLDLANDPRFWSRSEPLLDQAKGAVRDLFGALGLLPGSIAGGDERAETDAEFERQRHVVWMLLGNLDVARIGSTYLLSVSYTAANPELAAEVVSELAAAYLAEQRSAKFDAARRAGDWMGARLDELREQTIASDLAVQRYRQENDLTPVGDTYLAEVQLVEINRLLMDALAQRVSAEGRWRRLDEQPVTGAGMIADSETLTNPIINEIRSLYLARAKRREETARLLGAEHPQTQQLQDEMDQFSRLIADEFGRVARSYEEDYRIALAREDLLRKELGGLEKAVAGINERRVTLRKLEAESETFKELYGSVLHRYQVALQQQSFPTADARVITEAVRPLNPSHPRETIVIAVGLILGALLGFGVATTIESRRRTTPRPLSST